MANALKQLKRVSGRQLGDPTRVGAERHVAAAMDACWTRAGRVRVPVIMLTGVAAAEITTAFS